MTCTVIIVDNAIDQIVEHGEGWKGIVAREVKDLNKMGCDTRTMVFVNEEEAYAWEEKRKGR